MLKHLEVVSCQIIGLFAVNEFPKNRITNLGKSVEYEVGSVLRDFTVEPLKLAEQPLVKLSEGNWRKLPS